MAVEKFTVFAYDLNTNSLLCEAPYRGLSFDSRLNDAGAISFDIPLDKAGVTKIVSPLRAYAGNPVALYVDRNGVIVWGGIGWTGDYDRASGVWAIGGKEFGSYFDVRLAAADYSVTTYPSGLAPDQLILKVYTDAQNIALAGAGASIGITVVGPTVSLPTIIPGYPLDQHTFVSKIVQDMAAIIQPGNGGIDTQFTSAWSPTTGLPVNKVVLWTPRVGRAAGSTGLAFDLATALNYRWATDASASGTTIITTGAGSGSALPIATTNALGVPVGGLGQTPRIDKIVSTTAQSQSQVTAMAAGIAQQYGKPLTTPILTLRTAADPPLGSWIVGDDALLTSPPDAFFATGLSQYWRIVQQAVTVPEEGVATVDLTFNTPPVY